MIRKELQLLISVAGIYFCYFKVGLIEEHLFKSNFGSIDSNPSPKFEFSSILIFLQMSLYNLLCVTMIFRNKIKFVCTITEGSYLGLLNFTSMIGALTALQYVSFPLQALVKSCKQVFMKIIESSQYQQLDQYLEIKNLQNRIYTFNISESNTSNNTSSIFGIILLIASLFSDGCLATLQSKFKVKKLEQWEMGFHITLWSFIGSIFYTIIQGKFIQFLSYIQQYPKVIPQIGFLTINSVLGQVFIFYCISCFSPRVLSLITTTRKFFTVLLSIIIHNHNVNQIQWIAISLVAFGVTKELLLGMSSKIHIEKKKDSYIKLSYNDDQQLEQQQNNDDNQLLKYQQQQQNNDDNQLLEQEQQTNNNNKLEQEQQQCTNDYNQQENHKKQYN
ncbi:unnamed protein product [Paramecium sonneborni]|uniref:Uncharacterized protein n=1 Tax=Paramecium sonneborni TaxID=65129 RepID=A0A8S1RE57_9CILI|nr:unnamed protein product [Paramecium sonneborni]